ncbi:MAG: chemotaxis protein CheX [Desulfobacterales bacterium]|nr:chemotaxis protein CheX [Desulfobacterales bacterium]
MKKIEEMIRISIFEVFEKMFFIFLEPLDDENNEYDMEAAIRFEGAANGNVSIFLSTGVAETMVQNMLSLQEHEITTQSMEDCSKEAVNMICGNFLGKLNSKKVFHLSTPIFRKQPRDIELGKNACRMDFDSDAGRVGMMATLSD